MPLFEHVPYTNYQNVNLDWLLNKVHELELDMVQVKDQITEIQSTLTEIDERITTIEGDITTINETITVIQGDITEINETIQELNIDEIVEQIRHIEEVLADLDIDAIWSAIETNNNQSIARDDDLSRRISLLEQATINPINQYLGTENLILYGSDFRNLPQQAINDKGLPFGMMYGNGEITQDPNGSAIQATKYGLTANQGYTGHNYDYWTLAQLPDMPRSSYSLNKHITVTFAVASSTNPNTNPTLYSYTIGTCNQNIALDWLGGAYLHLDAEQTPRDFLALDIRSSGLTNKIKTALNGKYITYIRVEYGDASSGLHYNDHDSYLTEAIASYTGQLSPSDVEEIVHDNLASIVGEVNYDHAYNVTLTPADGSASYSIPAELDLRLTWKLGFLAGILALNIPMSSAEMDIDLSKSFDMVVDISDLDVPPKTIRADTIHFFSDLFTGAQFDLVLNSAISHLTSMRVWGAMKPIHLSGSVGDKKTIAVIKIFEPSVWTQPTPDTP